MAVENVMLILTMKKSCVNITDMRLNICIRYKSTLTTGCSYSEET